MNMHVGKVCSGALTLIPSHLVVTLLKILDNLVFV